MTPITEQAIKDRQATKSPDKKEEISRNEMRLQVLNSYEKAIKIQRETEALAAKIHFFTSVE